MVNTPAKIQIVKHIFPSYFPLYEMQVWSNDREKWIAAHTSHKQASITEFIETYYTGLDCPEINCLHDRGK